MLEAMLRFATSLAIALAVAASSACRPETQLTPRRKAAIEAAIGAKFNLTKDNPFQSAWVEREPIVPGLFAGGASESYAPSFPSWTPCFVRGSDLHCEADALAWVVSEYDLGRHPDRFSSGQWIRLVAHGRQISFAHLGSHLVQSSSEIDPSCRDKLAGPVGPVVSRMPRGGTEVRLITASANHHSRQETYARGLFRAEPDNRVSWESRNVCQTPWAPPGSPAEPADEEAPHPE